MIRLSSDSWREIAAKLNDAGPGRPQIVASIAAELQCTEQTVYRRAKQHGYNSGRKIRADKGSSDLPDSTIVEIAEVVSNSQRKNGKFTMTTRGAIEILARNGRLDPGRVSIPNVNLRLRQMGLNKRRLAAPPPITPLRSRYPNDVHQIDMSNCIQYYDKNGKVGIRTVSSHYYKNKLHNFTSLVNKPVFIRYALTDHWSGAMWFRYYYAPGVNTADVLDFFYRCWTPKTDPGHAPFCGVPDQIMTDKDGVFRASATQDLFKNLGIRWHTGGKEKNARARGQVEKAHHMVEMFFECNLKEEQALSLEQMNEWADIRCREFNSNYVHSRHGHARFPFWSANVRDHLRLPPEDIEIFKMCALSKAQDRTVNVERTVSFEGRKYWIDNSEYLHGDKLEVRYSPFDYPDVIVENKTSESAPVLNLRALTYDRAGFRTDAVAIGAKKDEGVHAHHTITQQSKKLLAEARERIEKDGGLEGHNYDAPDTVQFQPHLRAEEINVNPIIPEYPIEDAKEILMNRMGIVILTDRDIDIIQSAWADKTTVTATEIDAIYEQLTEEEITEATA